MLRGSMRVGRTAAQGYSSRILQSLKPMANSIATAAHIHGIPHPASHASASQHPVHPHPTSQHPMHPHIPASRDPASRMPSTVHPTSQQSRAYAPSIPSYPACPHPRHPSIPCIPIPASHASPSDVHHARIGDGMNAWINSEFGTTHILYFPDLKLPFSKQSVYSLIFYEFVSILSFFVIPLFPLLYPLMSSHSVTVVRLVFLCAHCTAVSVIFSEFFLSYYTSTFSPEYQFLTPPFQGGFPYVCCREQEAACGLPLQTSQAFLFLSSWVFSFIFILLWGASRIPTHPHPMHPTSAPTHPHPTHLHPASCIRASHTSSRIPCIQSHASCILHSHTSHILHPTGHASHTLML